MDESHVGNYAASSPTPGVSSPAASSPTPGVSDERIEKSVLPDHGRAVPRDPAYARTHLHDTSNGHTLCFKNLSTSITAAHIEELFVAKQIPAPKRLEIHYSGHVDFKGTAFARFGSASVGRFQQENHKSVSTIDECDFLFPRFGNVPTVTTTTRTYHLHATCSHKFAYSY